MSSELPLILGLVNFPGNSYYCGVPWWFSTSLFLLHLFIQSYYFGLADVFWLTVHWHYSFVVQIVLQIWHWKSKFPVIISKLASVSFWATPCLFFLSIELYFLCLWHYDLLNHKDPKRHNNISLTKYLYELAFWSYMMLRVGKDLRRYIISTPSLTLNFHWPSCLHSVLLMLIKEDLNLGCIL